MVLAVYRSGDSGLKNLEKKNHGVGSNDYFREQNLGKIGDFAEQSGRAGRSKIHFKK